MPYKSQIAAAKADLDALTKQIAGMRETHANSETITTAEQRKISIHQLLTRLQRLQWEEDHERVNLDDDR